MATSACIRAGGHPPRMLERTRASPSYPSYDVESVTSDDDGEMCFNVGGFITGILDDVLGKHASDEVVDVDDFDCEEDFASLIQLSLSATSNVHDEDALSELFSESQGDGFEEVFGVDGDDADEEEDCALRARSYIGEVFQILKPAVGTRTDVQIEDTSSSWRVEHNGPDEAASDTGEPEFILDDQAHLDNFVLDYVCGVFDAGICRAAEDAQISPEGGLQPCIMRRFPHTLCSGERLKFFGSSARPSSDLLRSGPLVLSTGPTHFDLAILSQGGIAPKSVAETPPCAVEPTPNRPTATKMQRPLRRYGSASALTSAPTPSLDIPKRKTHSTEASQSSAKEIASAAVTECAPRMDIIDKTSEYSRAPSASKPRPRSEEEMASPVISPVMSPGTRTLKSKRRIIGGVTREPAAAFRMDHEDDADFPKKATTSSKMREPSITKGYDALGADFHRLDDGFGSVLDDGSGSTGVAFSRARERESSLAKGYDALGSKFHNASATRTLRDLQLQGSGWGARHNSTVGRALEPLPGLRSSSSAACLDCGVSESRSALEVDLGVRGGLSASPPPSSKWCAFVASSPKASPSPSALGRSQSSSSLCPPRFTQKQHLNGFVPLPPLGGSSTGAGSFAWASRTAAKRGQAFGVDFVQRVC